MSLDERVFAVAEDPDDEDTHTSQHGSGSQQRAVAAAAAAAAEALRHHAHHVHAHARAHVHVDTSGDVNMNIHDQHHQDPSQQDFSVSPSSSRDETLFPTVRERLSMSRRPGRPGRRPGSKRRPWSQQEVANILEGCAKFGVGKWKEILNAFPFNERTAVDLKDKFRNLKLKYGKHKLTLDASNAAISLSAAATAAAIARAEGEDPNVGLEVPTDPALLADTTNVGGSNTSTNPDHVTAAAIAAAARAAEVEAAAAAAVVGSDSAHSMVNMPPSDVDEHNITAILRELPYAQHRKRVPFSSEEDAKIRDGVRKYGKAWSTIAKAPEYGFHRRTGPDIRTRFSILLAKGDLDLSRGELKHEISQEARDAADLQDAVAAVTAGASAMSQNGHHSPNTITVGEAVAAASAAVAAGVPTIPETLGSIDPEIMDEGKHHMKLDIGIDQK